MQIVQCGRNLLGYFLNALIFQLHMIFMYDFVQTPSTDKLCNHVIVEMRVESDAHVQNDIWMSEHIDNVDFFDEILNSNLADLPFPKAFDGDSCTKPAADVHVTIATCTDEV